MQFVVETNKRKKEDWNQFVAANPYGSFLQGFEWGLFQESLGRRVFRLAISHIAQALVIKYNLPFGKSYLYSPHGPIIEPKPAIGNPTCDEHSRTINIFKTLSKEVKKIAQKEQALFWRIDPIMPDNAEERNIFKKLGLQKLSREIQPKKTLVLDLAKSEKELLGQMHQKTRYNIRLAGKKGATVKVLSISSRILDKVGKSSIDAFCELLQATAKRDGFRIHSKQYYQEMLKAFSLAPLDSKHLTGQAELFLAEYKEKIIAANIVVFFGKRATYLHGASDYKYRNLMAPYLLQWHQIKEAKIRGLSEYDFWGIDDKKWPGVSRFKKGFGGRETTYIGAWDLVYQPTWYKIYNLARKVKK